MDQSKFAVNISQYLVNIPELDLDIYDFRSQSLETQEDLKHHVWLCKELAYFERKKLDEVDFKYDEEYFLIGQKKYPRAKIWFLKLWFLKEYVSKGFRGNLKKEHVSFSSYRYAWEFLSDLLVSYPFKKGDGYVYAKLISPRIEIVRKILQVKQLFSCEDILEVGCGMGINLILLNRLAGETKLSGFEYPAARYASALANFEISGVNLDNFFLADVRDLPIRDNSFDLVFSCHVLEQMREDLERAINEIVRIAKKAIVLCEPSNFRAPFIERLYLKYRCYSENLIDVLEKRKDVQVIEHSKRVFRQWLNPSNFIVLKKN